MTARVVAFEVQAGTSGRSIAQAVASRMGYSYHEEDILVSAASMAGISNEAMAKAERWPSFFLRLGEILEAGRSHEIHQDLLGSPANDGSGWLLAERNRQCLANAVTRIAERGDCVLVGHAAHAILRARNCHGLFTVFVHGSEEARASHYAKARDIGLDEAERFIEASDRREAGYLKHIHGIEDRDAHQYDLSISMDHVGDAAAAELIVAGAQGVAESSEVLHRSAGWALRRRTQGQSHA